MPFSLTHSASRVDYFIFSHHHGVDALVIKIMNTFLPFYGTLFFFVRKEKPSEKITIEIIYIPNSLYRRSFLVNTERDASCAFRRIFLISENYDEK